MAKPEKAGLSVRLPSALVEQVRQEADDRVVSPAVLVQKALEAYLPTLPALDAVGTDREARRKAAEAAEGRS